MGDINYFIRKDIHDLRKATDGFRWGKVPALKMSVPVKVIPRFGNADQPVDGFESLVSLGLFVMDTKRGRMGDENIEDASVLHAVQIKLGEHAKSPQVCFRLCVLVCPVGPVSDGP